VKLDDIAVPDCEDGLVDAPKSHMMLQLELRGTPSAAQLPMLPLAGADTAHTQFDR